MGRGGGGTKSFMYIAKIKRWAKWLSESGGISVLEAYIHVHIMARFK